MAVVIGWRETTLKLDRVRLGAVVIALGLVVAVGLFVASKRAARQDDYDLADFVGQEATMQIKSNSFNEGEPVPAKYTCDGDNINPPLAISGVPDGVQSLVLIVDDPDSPSGTSDPGWIHWIVFNMPPDTQIGEDSIPTESTTGRTDFGNNSYGGPCPPSGTHRYVFHLYALDKKLDLPEGATKSDILQAMKGQVLDEAVLTGLYSKS